MSSIWRHPKSKYWTACFRDTNGRQRRVSTKATDRKQAKRLADEFEKAIRTKRTLRQAQTVLDRLHQEISGEAVSRRSLRQYAAEWLSTKAPELAASTLYAYRGGVEQLLTYLGPRADAPLTELTKSDFLAYRNHLAANLTTQTVNNHVALLKMIFKSARRDGVLVDNPAEFVSTIRERGHTNNKRPFSLVELQAVLSVADDEWRSLILFGLYTGQRLGDLARLSWNNLDLDRNEVRLVTGKTSRSMVIPIALPLRAHIDSLSASDTPDALLHPRAFDILVRNGKAGVLSAHFSNLLAQAGLREKQSHHPCGIGRSGRRRVNELTFHSLRRTATTWLHEAGVASSVAQALIGHESDKVHQGYVTVGKEALKTAVGTFPQL